MTSSQTAPRFAAIFAMTLVSFAYPGLAFADLHVMDYCAEPDVQEYYTIPEGNPQGPFDIGFYDDFTPGLVYEACPGETFRATAGGGYDCDNIEKALSHCGPECYFGSKCIETWDNNDEGFLWTVSGYFISSVVETSPNGIVPNTWCWITAYPAQINSNQSIQISIWRGDADHCGETRLSDHAESARVVPAWTRYQIAGANPAVNGLAPEADCLLWTEDMLMDSDGDQRAGGGSDDHHVCLYYGINLASSNLNDPNLGTVVVNDLDTWWRYVSPYNLIYVNSIYGGTRTGLAESYGSRIVIANGTLSERVRALGHERGHNEGLYDYNWQTDPTGEWADNIMWHDNPAGGVNIRPSQVYNFDGGF